MLQLFGIHWIMRGSVAGLLFSWQQWLGKHNSDVWNLVPGYLLWILWTKLNWRTFEDIEKSLAYLIDLCQQALFDWSRCWGLSIYSSLTAFPSSLSLVS